MIFCHLPVGEASIMSRSNLGYRGYNAPKPGASRRWTGSLRITRAFWLRRWSTPVVLDWNQRILRAAEAGDPQDTDQGLPQARRIS